MRDHFIGLSALGAAVISKDRLAVARCLGKPHIARDLGLINLIREKLFDFFNDLKLKIQAVVIHGKEDAFDIEAGIIFALDDLDRLIELGETLQ